MDGFRDRLSSRYDRSDRADKYERGSQRDSSDYDRYDRTERGRRSSSDMDASSISEAIDRSNKNQLDVIADLFDEARDDRLESEKVIVRAVDDNAQLLSDIAKAIKNMQGGNMGAVVTAPTQQTEEFFDSPSVDPSAKDEILRVVGDNKQLLTLIRQDVITIAQNQSQEPSTIVNEPVDIPDFLLASVAEQYYKDMEEHVHKENVKCFKNVQAAITEQNATSVKEFTKALSGIKIISILSLVFSVVSLVLIAAFVFGLI